MFENLTNKLENIFSKLKSAPSLTEEQVDSGLKEIRLALLEADVALSVVKEFIENVRPKAIGQEIIKSTSREVDLMISWPIAFGLTFSMNSFTTDRATSASNKAKRISFKPESTCSSVKEGALFSLEKIFSNLFVKFSNIFITSNTYRTSGRTFAD